MTDESKNDLAFVAPVSLGYAPVPSTRRRWARRLRRAWPAYLLLALIGLGIGFGPRAWRHWPLLRLQERCLTANLPMDRPMIEGDLTRSSALAVSHPGEYRFDSNRLAFRVEPLWAQLGASLNIAGAGSEPTLFIHERFTPSGKRRLLVVEGLVSLTVIEPAGWFNAAKVLKSGSVIRPDDDRLDVQSLALIMMDGGNITSGQADPADPTKFTVVATYHGIAGTWEYRLDDANGISVRMLDKESMIAKVQKAVERERTTELPATQPARK